MSASDNLQPYQLSMFMPAGKLAHPLSTQHLDQNGFYSHRQLRQYKVNDTLHAPRGGNLHDASSSGSPVLPDSESVYGQIKEEGVHTPVTLASPKVTDPAYGKSSFRHPTRPTLHDGHHRVFASNHIDPKREIPVRWDA